MSIARHHAEWLSLVPVSGPFLSLPVLMEAFNTGLESHDPEITRLLRQEYSTWHESFEKRKADPAPHHNWIKFVLTKALDLDDRVLVEGQAISQTLQVEVLEHHELLRPSIVVTDPVTKNARLLIQTYSRAQELTSYVAGSSWKASPDTRMTELLHGTGVRLGLVTNGEHWMLVDAPKGETTGYASWYASLWLEEPLTLRAFRSLLSASRFFNVPDDQTLEALLTKSASNQQEVTNQLGYQVRQAVEVLIHSLDRADQDFGRELLADVAPEQLYESALTVMMRLVFLFCAEERELIPGKPFPVYEQNYSVSTISKQLRDLADQHGEELLERRFDAWPRLLAAFRTVYGGLKHDDLHIPAYGGNLFNPDRFPFLEGRQRGTSWRAVPAHPLPVNNRTVLHLLEALQYLETKVPGSREKTRRRLSFRALDIEQIGHVYEGLLDHTAKRAAEPFLGLAGTREKEPELSLAKLEELLANGEDDLVRFLKDQTGRSESALRKSLKVELDNHEAARFRTACESDEALWRRVEPLVGLVRKDSFGYPVVIPKGSVFITAGTDRRSSGTHYTPRSLTEPIVQYTLEPLVYVGPAEGMPKGEWRLKSARELLELKICDLACGSGAFLVQAARYMAERLLEAWDNAKTAHPDTPGITPEGMPSTGKTNEALIPDDPAERKTYAMRIIAQRCLYGVDKNPLAVEMAKLSLWLLTLARDKPFEFLDHSIRCGDSLVGLHSIEQLRHYRLKPDPNDAVLFKGPLDSAVDEAITLRLKLEDLPTNTVEDVQRQEQLLAEANEKIARLRCAADLLVAAEFWGENAKDKLERVRHASNQSVRYFEKGLTEEFERVAAKERRGQTMFHWPLEFPEVIVKRGGFDAFSGNPPFLGGKRISTEHGDNYERYLKTLFDRSKGAADLCCYFFRRVFSLLGTPHAFTGLLATSSIVEGDSREVSLGVILSDGGRIYSARPSFAWPGQAGVFAAQIHFSRTPTLLVKVIDEHSVEQITTHLDSHQTQSPHAFSRNKILYTQGQTLNGEGFLIDSPTRDVFLRSNQKNDEVIAPYINGDIFNNIGELIPRRWAITFGTREKDAAACFKEPFQLVTELVKPHRDKLTRQVHEARYWLYWDKREAFFNSIANRERILVCPIVTKYLSFRFFPINWVFSHRLKLFDVQDFEIFGALQSSLYEVWARQFSSTLGQTMNYSTSDAFDTFCFPSLSSEILVTAKAFYDARETILVEEKFGLTYLYNCFNDAEKAVSAIRKLHELQVNMDHAVAAAYGWTDLDLDHGFHKTKQGVRFTISEPARQEVLQRLLKLNHERYAEEVRQGLHDKKGAARKATPKRKTASNTTTKVATLFDLGEDDK